MNPTLLAKIESAQPNPSLTLDTAIQRYLNGESMQVLAKELGIARRTIYNWMMRRSGGPEEWAALRQQALIARIAEADEELENASDPVRIARAREQCRFARMDYERLHKDYAPKQEVSTDEKITVIIAREAAPTLDITPNYVEKDQTRIMDNSASVRNDEDNPIRV